MPQLNCTCKEGDPCELPNLECVALGCPSCSRRWGTIPKFTPRRKKLHVYPCALLSTCARSLRHEKKRIYGYSSERKWAILNAGDRKYEVDEEWKARELADDIAWELKLAEEEARRRAERRAARER